MRRLYPVELLTTMFARGYPLLVPSLLHVLDQTRTIYRCEACAEIQRLAWEAAQEAAEEEF